MSATRTVNRFLDHEGYGPIKPPINDDFNFEFEEGRAAFVADRPLHSNDYPPNNPNGGPNKSHAAWKSGWCAAARSAGAY